LRSDAGFTEPRPKEAVQRSDRDRPQEFMTEIEVQQVIAPRPAFRSKGFRAYILLSAFLALRGFGNLSLAWGTKHLSGALSMNVLSYGRALLDPFVALAIAMLILALLVRMALLSLADLSFVLPMTAVGYVISTLLGKVFLHEQVSPERWLGVALIFAGVAIVGSTSEKTTKELDLIK
jgi:drug/metabolite transporter (DMT)-like permease